MENVIEFRDSNLIEEEACRWVIKFSGDEPPSAADIEALRAWVDQDPAHRAALEEYAWLWEGLDLLSELVSPAETKAPAAGRELPLLRPIGFALTLLMALGMGLVLWWNQPNVSDNFVTRVGEQLTRTLADGSTLWLNTNSQVEVNYSGSHRRLRLVYGEAHFAVEPDPERPFEVYAGDRMVRAVGTAFSVYLGDNRVKVVVAEGRVDLAVVAKSAVAKSAAAVRDKLTTTPAEAPFRPVPESTHLADVEIKPVGSLRGGQSVEIPADLEGAVNNIVQHEQQELARRLAWIEGKLVFVGEPLDEVVQEVSRYTSLRIEFMDESVKKLRIGGSFQVGQTEALFEALTLGFGVKIKRVSDRHVQLFASR